MFVSLLKRCCGPVRDPVVKVESRVPEAAREKIAGLGHTIETLRPWGGGGAVQLIQLDRERGEYCAAGLASP